jgi:hypothetical protein
MDLNLRDLGAIGNGIDDDSPAWRAARDLFATAGGGTLRIPAGVYNMARFGTSPWCLDGIGKGVTVEGPPDAVIRMRAGMPAASISLLRLNEQEGNTFRGITFDGNWGNTVGGVNDHTGINHSTQTDPKSHLVMVRGSRDIVFEDVKFRDSYGDHIWIGHASDPNPATPSFGVYLNRCTGDMSARNGFTIGGRCERIRVTDSHFHNIYSQACDFEPSHAVYDVHCRGSSFGLWWAPREAANSSVTVDGGVEEVDHAEYVRFDDCTIDGCFLVQRATDVQVRGCRLRTNWGGKSWAPVVIRFNCDRITFENNEVWDSNVSPQATPTQNNANAHAAAMEVDFYASAATNRQPRNVSLICNRIWTQRGVHGIRACGSGADGGVVDLIENRIDLSDVGAGNGGRGIDIFAERPGMRVRTRGNRSRNAVGEHMRVRFATATNQMRELDIADEKGIDDQAVPTLTTNVKIDSPRFAASISVRDTDGVVGYP